MHSTSKASRLDAALAADRGKQVETAAPRASMKKRSGVLLLLAVGALCGATYFLSNAHAVPVVGPANCGVQRENALSRTSKQGS